MLASGLGACDGSTDGSHAPVEALERSESGLQVIYRSRNGARERRC